MKISPQHNRQAAAGAVAPELPRQALDRAWSDFQRDWASSSKKLHDITQSVPEPSRRLVELQLLSQQLHLRSLVAAKAGESLSGFVRRVQQMGNS